jgi:hypothetical protein
MLAKTIISFAALAASVSAILVTSPAKDAKVDFSKDVTITWTSVNTDPSTFTLELVDQSNVNSPIVINKEVTTSDDKYTLSDFVAPTGSTYKFNFISNDPENSGILAQSQSFTIVKSAESSSSSASASATDSTTSSSSSAEPTVVTTAVTGSVTTTNSAGVTTTMKTVSSKTTTASATAETSGANASSTGAATPSNAAVVLDKTFALGGGLLAALLMAF